MRINKSLITNQVTGAGTGSVTSVAMTVPTGFVVSGTPITSSGTLSITFDTGYSLPQFPSQTGNNGKYLTTDGTNLSWATVTVGGVSGTVNYLAKFDTTASVADSIIYENGFVGIGTTTAGTGSLIISSTTADNHLQLNGTAPSIRFTDTPTSATYNQVIGQVITANNFITNTVAGDMAIANASGGSILFGIGSTEALRIFTSTGNVSINGTSTDTGDRLYVSGGIKATAQLKLTGYTSTSSYTGTAVGYLGFDSAGNILSSAAPSGTNIYNSDGTLTGNRALSLSTYYLRVIGTSTTSFFSTGNVVIGGTTDAGYKLDVQGTGNFSNNLRVVPVGGGELLLGLTNYVLRFRDNGNYTRFEINQNGVGNNTTLIGGGLLGAVNISMGTTGMNFAFPNSTNTSTYNFSRVFQGNINSTARTLFDITTTHNSALSNATKLTAFYVRPTATDWVNLIAWENTVGNMLLGTTSGSVGIGANTTINSSAILDITSTNKGFLPPRMTGAQAEAISSPAEGLMVYANNGNGTTITSTGWWGYNGTTWVKIN